MRQKKKIIFFTLLLIAANNLFAQTDTSLLYLRFPSIPPFTITTVPDSVKFTKADLHKKKATIVMIFSPDCEHCQHEVNELKAHTNLLKKAQIIMTSPVEYKFIKKFYDEYKLTDYPNIIVGRDATYMLGTFYSIKSFPTLFLYNKKGKFVKAFDGNVPIQKIAEAL
jgi:thioredoxin-related protein